MQSVTSVAPLLFITSTFQAKPWFFVESSRNYMKNQRLRRVPLPTFKSQAWRLLWLLTWFFLYRPTPVFLHSWRRLLLRFFGSTIGDGAWPYPNARVWAPWNLVMESASCLGPGVECYNPDVIRVGPRATVSQRAFLCSASHDPHDRDFSLVVGEIIIGPGAWIAAEAFIGPGVVVGQDALVAARAVVVRDVPENVIVAGNPAESTGQRYTSREDKNEGETNA